MHYCFTVESETLFKLTATFYTHTVERQAPFKAKLLKPPNSSLTEYVKIHFNQKLLTHYVISQKSEGMHSMQYILLITMQFGILWSACLDNSCKTKFILTHTAQAHDPQWK